MLRFMSTVLILVVLIALAGQSLFAHGTTIESTRVKGDSASTQDPWPADVADRALVIGIDRYRNVDELVGCSTDALRIADALRRLGFACDVLTDQTATRANIIDALSRIGAHNNKTIKVNDRASASRLASRTVVYYAGRAAHLPNGEVALLPVDAAADKDSQKDLTCSEVDSYLSRTKAANLVMLDVGLAPLRNSTNNQLLSSKLVRYQVRAPDDNFLQPSSLKHTLDKDDICYVIGCMDGEAAGVGSGQQTGRFTTALIKEFQALPDEAVRESNLPTYSTFVQRVAEDVGTSSPDNSGDLNQHPQYSGQYSTIALFGEITPPTHDNGKEAAASQPHPSTQGEEASGLDSPLDPLTFASSDARFIKASLSPDVNRYTPGRDVRVSVDVKRDAPSHAFLVIVSTGPDGKLDVLFPDPATAKAAQTEPGGHYDATLDRQPTLGHYLGRAYLLNDAAAARDLIGAALKSDGEQELRSSLIHTNLRGSVISASMWNWDVSAPSVLSLEPEPPNQRNMANLGTPHSDQKASRHEVKSDQKEKGGGQ